MFSGTMTGFKTTLSGLISAGASPDSFRLRKIVPVIDIVNHPDFLRPTFENDLALLRLHESVDLNTFTPVCLPEVGVDFTGRKGWVYGQ